MKTLNRITVCIMAVCVLVSSGSVLALNSYIEQARVFYHLGLYNGISQTAFVPDLEFYLDRETAAVFLIRLMGLAPNVQSAYGYQSNTILNNYNDSYLVSNWAKASVIYALKANIYPDVSDGFIMPRKFIDGKTFTSMLLKCMGISLTQDNHKISSYINSYLGGVSADEAKYLNEKIMTKNDMIAIVWESFDVKLPSGISFLEKIVQNNNLRTDQLTRLGFIYQNGKLLAPVFNSASIYQNYGDATVYYMRDGSQYVGETQRGVPNGNGRVNYEDGSVYEGHVSEGLRHVNGKFIRADGFVYLGGWKDDYMNGYAVMQWPNGDKYEGNVLAGVFSGQGTMQWANGDTYTGDWSQGEFNGYGRFQWSNGNYYDGSWSEGKFHGYGFFLWENGEKYEGNWFGGKRHGWGMLTKYDNTVLTGHWENDMYIGE